MIYQRLNPKLQYRGLTIVMSNPSRFDKASLLSANGGSFFSNECLRPEINVMQCQVRVKEDRSPLLPNTKVVLLLGQDAFQLWTGNPKDNTLNEARGSVFRLPDGTPCIPSYLPQEAVDLKDYESQFNDNTEQVDHTEEGSDGEESEKSRKAATRRPNWPFWLKADTKKAVRILQNGGEVPAPLYVPKYIIYPDIEQCITQLLEHKNKYLYIDIETDYERNITVLAFSFGVGHPIFVVPFLTHTYARAYSNLAGFLRALAISFRDNIVVAHNGSNFDYVVFATKYKLAVRRCYDSMLAWHRCFPEVEKSLGHVTSYFTYEPFHKDESNFSYNTPEVCQQLWRYCGKDVYTMILIHKAIEDHAARTPGLAASIQQVNDSIPAYLTMSLQGIKYDEQIRAGIVLENDRLMMQYLRMIDILVGSQNLKAIRGKTSKSPMPGSNKQCCTYFHDMMGYPVVARSKKTKMPSLAKTAMYKLRLRQDNPVIDLCLRYRMVQHESGMLGFEPYKKPEEPKIQL